jgi:DNA repair exonuclease SbcCD ATPase subunit
MNADGDIRVVLHDREVPIFNLSGAMKDIFALAMRYGLLRIAARNVNFMVLDEPTRHMDPDNCDRLKEIFDHLLDHQLIVVTINDVLSDARGKHFEVSKDDSLASRIEEL